MHQLDIGHLVDPDGTKPTSKWKSAWDLTERQKEKLQEKERKKSKKQKRSLISQGLLDLINIGELYEDFVR